MAEEELRESEAAAIESSQADYSTNHTTNVVGRKTLKASKKKMGAVGASVFLMVILLISVALIFSAAPVMVDAIATRLIEETDVQYADAVQSKALVFQNALSNGEIPKNTAERLEQEGVTVGYMDGDTFVASRFGKTLVASNDVDIIYSDKKGSALSLKIGDKVISADQFYYEVNHNVELYNAFTNATYSRAAYYYDEEAQRVFRELGTNRNNYSGDESLDETMDQLMGSGHSFGVNNETWLYLPWWDLESRSSPKAEIKRWDIVENHFSCNGVANGEKFVIWRSPNVRGPYHSYDKDGNIIDTWYEIDNINEYGDYGCLTNQSSDFIRTLSQSNMTNSSDFTQTTLNTVDSLKVTDTISKEKRSALLYVGIAESISKMKAGFGKTNTETDNVLAALATVGATGNNSDVNAVMNWLYDSQDVTVTDMQGNSVTLSGSAVESPSLYAILTGEKLDANEVNYYSSDRVAKIAEYKMGRSEIGESTMSKTIITTNKGGTATLGRCTEMDADSCTESDQSNRFVIATEDNIPNERATSGYNLVMEKGSNYNKGNSSDVMTAINPVINTSLYENSFGDIVGINAGEMLVEGAANLGKSLAKASGASAGNKDSVDKYLALTSDVLAMDAAADRLNRSPLDITSKNTFLGSIVHKFAVSSINSSSLFNKIGSLSRVTISSLGSFLPRVNAEDNSEDLYLSVFGDCETLDNIDAVGTATCSSVATFDTSTYGGENGQIYSSGDFKSFIDSNVECSGNSNCAPKEDSSLAKYISYNELRVTPVGITDGSIVESVENKESGGIFGRFLSAISNLLGLSKKIKDGTYKVPPEATGESFVVGNKEWNDYKYAQRYISLARAAEAMRQYDGDETAYNFDGFGLGNPIARYIEEKTTSVVASNE